MKEGWESKGGAQLICVEEKIVVFQWKSMHHLLYALQGRLSESSPVHYFGAIL